MLRNTDKLHLFLYNLLSKLPFVVNEVFVCILDEELTL
ncbi:hypothetical protein PRUB_b0697 [Pseudoalteromonas rubra]|uniref:Uncharacterized protein n=1 Tax=Pseudoalteromonas rubra TaxID=43658 RepID=A0A8T0C0N0_9GAMM|nr:hypothetical protein PRUB_b0697 [Pseudoalteromonas rubra]